MRTRLPAVAALAGILAASCGAPESDASDGGTSAPPLRATSTTLDKEGQTERLGAVGDPDEPITALEDGSTFDPSWTATVELGCSSVENRRVVETLSADTNERGTPQFYADLGEGRLGPIAPGDEIAADQLLFWSIQGILLGPWPIEAVSDRCDGQTTQRRCEQGDLTQFASQGNTNPRHVALASPGDDETIVVCDTVTAELTGQRPIAGGWIDVITITEGPNSSSALSIIQHPTPGTSQLAWVDHFGDDDRPSHGPITLYPETDLTLHCTDGQVRIVTLTLPTSASDPTLTWTERSLDGDLITSDSVDVSAQPLAAATIVNGRCGDTLIGPPFRAAPTVLSSVVAMLEAEHGATALGGDHAIDPTADMAYSLDGVEHWLAIDIAPQPASEQRDPPVAELMVLDCRAGRISLSAGTPRSIIAAIVEEAACSSGA